MKFSVLMSVYKNDHPEYLRQSLDSILYQTMKPNEIVLVIDGFIPKDIKQIIDMYIKNEPTLKIVKLEENQGLGIALREGLKQCSYPLVARMDADDICVLNRFEKQLQAFEADETLSVVGGYIQEFIDAVENKVGIREVPLEHKEICKYMKFRCPLNHMTVMFKKEDVEKCGSYMKWQSNEDYYLWLRMYLHHCKFKNLDEVLVYARVGREMYQRRGGIAYFKITASTQKYMLQNHITTVPQYLYNMLVRFIVQVVCPNSLRGFIYQHFARRSHVPKKKKFHK